MALAKEKRRRDANTRSKPLTVLIVLLYLGLIGSVYLLLSTIGVFTR